MKKFFEYLKMRPLAFSSLIFLIVLYLIMIFAPFFAPYSPTQTFESNTYHPSNVQFTKKGLKVREYRVIDKTVWHYVRVKDEECIHDFSWFVKGSEYKILGLFKCSIHLFGTKNEGGKNNYPVYLLGSDNLGRDLFSRIVYGSRISLTIGFVATFLSLFLAVLFGGFSGYFGGKVDWTIMRLSEFFMLIPTLYFILFLRSLLNTKMDSGTSYMLITLILSLVGWPSSARTIRGLVHSIKREDFIMDAKLEGLPGIVVIFKQIIPQTLSLLIVSTALSVPGFIMSETTLSYLGLGISDPSVSWGSLINRDISTISNLKNFPWLLYPVFMLLLVTLAFNFLSDALRDFYDPYNILFKKKKIKLSKNNTKSSVVIKQMNENELLSVENLFVNFNMVQGVKRLLVHAVRGVSFNVYKGEILGLVGESGSGKSVTTTAVLRLLGANADIEGHIFYNGYDLLSLSKNNMRLLRGKKIALIFQEPSRSFDPLMNIGSNFFEAFRNTNPYITKEEAFRKACKLLDEVGLPDSNERLKAFPHQFSGGQLQRVGIALALAQDPELLIADEPTTALDVTIQAQIVSLLLRLRKERGLSIIFISHNIQLVGQISDRIAVMYGGKLMEIGKSSQIINSPRHPYTQALVKASPEFGLHYTNGKMIYIPGKVTNPLSPQPGCPFAPRCNFSKAECIKSDFKECYKL